MKKLIAILITICIVVSLNVTALAKNKKYYIDDLELSLSVPDSYSVFTRDYIGNSSLLNKIGMSKKELVKDFKKNSIYFTALSSSVNEGIIVTMKESADINLNELTDSDLLNCVDRFKQNFIKDGYTLLNYKIYRKSQAGYKVKFLKFYLKDSSTYKVVYCTIDDGKAISFALDSYIGKISSKQESTIKNLIDSIEFDSIKEKVEDEDTESFTYEDTSAGIEFTVPKNWKRAQLSKKREYIDAKFVNIKNPAVPVMFGAKDVWASVSEADKEGMTREECNDDWVKNNIDESLGIEANNVQDVQYNDIHFYKYTYKTVQEEKGIKLPITLICMMHIENGWMYTFQFCGKETNKYFSDFEKILNSFSFNNQTNSETEKVTDSEKSNNLDEASKSSDNPIVIAIILGVIAAVIILVIVLKVKSKKNEKVVEQNEFLNSLSSLEDTNHNSGFVFCHKCGEKNTINNIYCFKCGAFLHKSNLK